MDHEALAAMAPVLAERLGWSDEAAYLGLRAGFHCEYCDRPLIGSIEDYDAWQNDHIHPRTRKGSDDYVKNKALACKTCNFIKRHTEVKCNPDTLSRAELVLLYREIVKERRARKQMELDKIHAALSELGVKESRLAW